MTYSELEQLYRYWSGNYNHTKFTKVKPLPTPKRVIYNNPATIIIWNDGTKTVAKCDKEDTYSKECGFMTCMLKKVYGNHDFRKMMKNLVYKEEKDANNN